MGISKGPKTSRTYFACESCEISDAEKEEPISTADRVGSIDDHSVTRSRRANRVGTAAMLVDISATRVVAITVEFLRDGIYGCSIESNTRQGELRKRCLGSVGSGRHSIALQHLSDHLQHFFAARSSKHVLRMVDGLVEDSVEQSSQLST